MRRIARRVGRTPIAQTKFRADHVALREFLLGHTRMHDRVQEAWWAGLRYLSPRDRGWQHLISEALAGPSVADTWLFYDHNDVLQWPPTRAWSEASFNRFFGYPAFIDDVTTELMLDADYPCYCLALQQYHSRFSHLLPATAAQAWTSGNGWSVGQRATGLLLELLGIGSTAPEANLLLRLTQHRSYDVVAERLSNLRLQGMDRKSISHAG
ncbi:hypothetical protein [Blastococcus sp. PRF04-17]|uniref:hypothetical protein n=1 Tax=Blastococcus sp. PRF04-17 TaxID=2933797 RepID=UPI001FF6C798|nr:hypothetical protein [Blastococcus sp. PRF04-17]UOY03702.1 hypothetical protein MVA48_10385 [Blastococcus sp. PRF04-17]